MSVVRTKCVLLPAREVSTPSLLLHSPWKQVSTLEPQAQHARALVINLQSQLSASAANWKQLVQAMISNLDPSNEHYSCIDGREYEVC
jgi:hypothetical protein